MPTFEETYAVYRAKRDKVWAICSYMEDYNKQFIDKKTKSKFYNYRQTNSGGSFQIDDNVTLNVVIEAYDDDHANVRAERIGIYFDGCEQGMDCECCGDRWYSSPDSYYDWRDIVHVKYNMGRDEPELPVFYYELFNKTFESDKEDGKNRIVIHLLDGTKIWL